LSSSAGSNANLQLDALSSHLTPSHGVRKKSDKSNMNTPTHCTILSESVTVRKRSEIAVSPVDSFATPKHSNCADAKSLIPNPYDVSVKAAQTNGYNTENHNISVISPLAPTTPVVNDAQWKRAAANKAKALAIRAKAMKSQIAANRAAAYQHLQANKQQAIGLVLRHGAPEPSNPPGSVRGDNSQCPICRKIVNPYLVDNSNKAESPPTCEACLSDINFTQESYVAEDV
jgi:hypothetical protein